MAQIHCNTVCTCMLCCSVVMLLIVSSDIELNTGPTKMWSICIMINSKCSQLHVHVIKCRA